MNDYSTLRLSKPKRLSNTIAGQGQEYKGRFIYAVSLFKLFKCKPHIIVVLLVALVNQMLTVLPEGVSNK
jgi:hypothetical protein